MKTTFGGFSLMPPEKSGKCGPPACQALDLDRITMEGAAPGGMDPILAAASSHEDVGFEPALDSLSGIVSTWDRIITLHEIPATGEDSFPVFVRRLEGKPYLRRNALPRRSISAGSRSSFHVRRTQTWPKGSRRLAEFAP